MKIGIIGELTRFEELKQTLPAGSEILHDNTLAKDGAEPDILFHLNFDTNSEELTPYLNLASRIPVILSSATIELRRLSQGKPLPLNLFGMNCIPGFINKSVKELSIHREDQGPAIQSLEHLLGWRISAVKDRVGMVTPRILFMIINEAYFTLQEGTANRNDIDTGMKLGTNYPMGPFEWCDKIGIKTVVSLLDALYQDTHDERYRVCSLLRTTSY